MPQVQVSMVDGSTRIFEHNRGDRYVPTVSYEIGFIIVTDRWGAEYAIPSEKVKEVYRSEPFN